VSLPDFATTAAQDDRGMSWSLSRSPERPEDGLCCLCLREIVHPALCRKELNHESE
jgi:hypothetical protein